MVREHALNTEWWGERVGVIDDPRFFLLAEPERRRLLEPFAWVEFSSDLSRARPILWQIAGAGFAQVDVQVNFRINLKAVQLDQSARDLEVVFADERAFDVASHQAESFTAERFLLLPDATQDRVDGRFTLWAAKLLKQSPDACMQLVHKGRVQGWFLARPDAGAGLNLTLAMKQRDAAVSGLHLYQRALRAYADRGHVLGWASFSLSNTAVQNLYSNLGARFTAPKGNWLWVR